MAGTKDATAKEMIIPKNIWTSEEAEKVFSSLLGDIKLASPEKLEECFVGIKDGWDLSDEGHISLAALYKYLGVVYLDEDNPVKAQEFFKNSIQCYENFISSNDSEEILHLKEEAVIYLNLSLLRNYDQMVEAEQYLYDCRLKHLTPANGALLFLAIDELQNHHSEVILTEFKQNTEAFEKTVLYRVVAACTSLAEYGLLEENFEKECQYYDLGKDEHLMVAKMMIRRAVSDDDPEILFKCSELIRQDCQKRGIVNSCSLANVMYANGKYHLGRGRVDKEKAEENFKSCYEIRRAKLGENHVETAEAKFELGRISFLRSLNPDSLPNPENYQLMWEALRTLEEHCVKGWYLHLNLCVLTEISAELLQIHGVFQASIDIFKDSAELIQRRFEIPLLRKRPYYYQAEDHRQDLLARIGEICLDWKKYELALVWFRKVWKNFEDESEERFDAWTRSVVGSAYCYFKLGDYISASKLFGLSDGSVVLTWDSLICCSYETEFLSSREHSCESTIAFQSSESSFALSSFNDARLNEVTRFLRANVQLGLIYETIEKSFSKAESYYLKVLKICAEETIYHHPVLCDSFLGLARIYLKQKNIPDCEKYAKKCLEITILLFGPNERNIEPVIDIFGQLVNYRKDIRKAKTVFSLYMERFTSMGLLDESEFTASFLHNFAERLYNSVNFGDAELNKCTDLFTKSYNVFTKLVGPKKKKTAESQRMLGLCHLRLGNIANAEWHLFNTALFSFQNKFS